MAGFILDTNHLSPALLRVSEIRDRIHQFRRTGHRFGTCIPVLCELEVAIQQTNRPESCRRYLSQVRKVVRLWPVDRETVQLFGELSLYLRRRGRILSHVDIVLAAMAKHMNLTLLTADKDFEGLPEIRKENWLSSA